MYDEARCLAACEEIARRIVAPSLREFLAAGGLAADAKADGSPVTAADREIEGRIRARLAEEFPEYGVVGEEFGAHRADREYVWTIDPIDGTEALIAGVPQFGTLLGLIHQRPDGTRVPVLGAVYLPVQDQLLAGNRRSAWLNGAPVRIPALPGPAERSLVLGDLAAMARDIPPERQQRVLALAAGFRTAQTWGDCLGYLNLVLGKAHGRIECGLGVDDVAPLEPILLGAGGWVSDWDGCSVTELLSGLPGLEGDSPDFGIVAAATPQLHRELTAGLVPVEQSPGNP